MKILILDLTIGRFSVRLDGAIRALLLGVVVGHPSPAVSSPTAAAAAAAITTQVPRRPLSPTTTALTDNGINRYGMMLCCSMYYVGLKTVQYTYIIILWCNDFFRGSNFSNDLSTFFSNIKIAKIEWDPPASSL